MLHDAIGDDLKLIRCNTTFSEDIQPPKHHKAPAKVITPLSLGEGHGGEAITLSLGEGYGGEAVTLSLGEGYVCEAFSTPSVSCVYRGRF